MDSRITEVPPEIVKDHADNGVVLTNHDLSDEERRKLEAAFEMLAPLHQTILQKHLRSISFVEGLPVNAQTVRVASDGPELLFDLVFNARLLGETLSEFATRKERTFFDAADSTLSISVVAGSMGAVSFVLLHEATHIVDSVLGFTPVVVVLAPPRGRQPTPTDRKSFGYGVWEDAITPASKFRGGPLDSIRLAYRGKPSIRNAIGVYRDLERTPFASIYGSLLEIEDMAELVAWGMMAEKYGQPYRIEVRDADRVVYAYEPFRSPLVRSRLGEVHRFDSAEIGELP